ncbi:MAG: hypothetical protein KDB82_15725 [Planctomycetes bacterium]|nr:hypothetical protein [Planctomycetota bacterium]
MAGALLVGAVGFGIYYGPQLLRRSVDYVSRPAPPPTSAHWTVQTAHYLEYEADLDWGGRNGWWLLPETATPDDHVTVINEHEPYSFECLTNCGGFLLHADGRAAFWVNGGARVRDSAGEWTCRDAGFVLFTELTPREMTDLARKLNDEEFGAMPRVYSVGVSDGVTWSMMFRQHGNEKFVGFGNVFPAFGRRIAGYIYRELAVPRAADLDAAEAHAMADPEWRKRQFQKFVKLMEEVRS